MQWMSCLDASILSSFWALHVENSTRTLYCTFVRYDFAGNTLTICEHFTTTVVTIISLAILHSIVYHIIMSIHSLYIITWIVTNYHSSYYIIISITTSHSIQYYILMSHYSLIIYEWILTSSDNIILIISIAFI